MQRVLLIFALIGVCFIVLLVGVLWTLSPWAPAPLVDSEGRVLPESFSEKIFLRINGVEQGMFIKSRDTRNPVLLYLHGGMPDYVLMQRYPAVMDT